MLQFSPGETHSTNASPETNWIIGDADGVAVTFVTTRKLAVDSGYDIKHTRFRTTSATSRIHSMLSFFRKFSKVHLPADGGIWDFDLPLEICPRWWTPTWQGLVVGAMLAAQGVVLIASNPLITDRALPIAAVVLVGLLTGLVASFGLRKP